MSCPDPGPVLSVRGDLRRAEGSADVQSGRSRDEITRPPLIEGSEFKTCLVEETLVPPPAEKDLKEVKRTKEKMGSPQMSDKSDQVILPPPATVHSQNQSPTAERGGSSENGSRGFEPEGRRSIINVVVSNLEMKQNYAKLNAVANHGLFKQSN